MWDNVTFIAEDLKNIVEDFKQCFDKEKIKGLWLKPARQRFSFRIENRGGFVHKKNALKALHNRDYLV